MSMWSKSTRSLVKRFAEHHPNTEELVLTLSPTMAYVSPTYDVNNIEGAHSCVAAAATQSHDLCSLLTETRIRTGVQARTATIM